MVEAGTSIARALEKHKQILGDFVISWSDGAVGWERGRMGLLVTAHPGKVMGPQAPSYSRRASTKQEKAAGQIRTQPAQSAKIVPSGLAEVACASWFCFPAQFSSARLLVWGLPTPHPALRVSSNIHP
jgi:hypothetical protein